MTDVGLSGEGPQFYPRDHWGLDYLFQTCNKLYICDILSLKDYPMFPGAYAYNNHPIYKVDVLGVVVRIEERTKCFLYAVDDGTGVIPVACWKNTFSDLTDCNHLDSVDPVFSDKVEELKSASRERTAGYHLGDLVHIKGKLQMFRNMKEIVSFYHKKVDNSMYEVLRMLELPALYKNHYDKPFTLPYKVAEEIKRREKESRTGILSEATKAKQLKPCVKDFLQRKKVTNFRTDDLLQDLEFREIMSQLKMNEGGNLKAATILSHVLSQMEEEGRLCLKSSTTGEYETLFQGCQLESVIINILRTECSKSKYMEKGCHLLHLLDELQKTKQYSKLQKSGLLVCLERLEAQSDIISSTNSHYLVFS